MKLARWCSLLLVPSAFAAVVVPSNKEVVESEVDLLQDAIQAADALANPWVNHQDIAVFLEKARLATNKAIHDETIRLQMEDGPTNLYELLNMIFSTEAISASQTHAAGIDNPLQGLINGAADVFNQVTSGVTTFLNNGKTGPAPVSPNQPKPLPFQLPDRNKGYADQPAVLIDGFFETLAFVTNDTGKILNDLTGGILNADTLNEGLDLISKTIEQFASGKIDLGEAINRVFGFFTKVFGAENPLGKFIQNLATYLSNNQDGILANVIKFTTFINAAIVTIGAIIFNSISNVVGGITKAVYNFFSGIVNNLLGSFLKRMQMGGDFGNMFMDMYGAQALEPSSIAQQFVNLVNLAIKKILAADPYIITNFLNPTEANITKVINTVTKVLTDKT